MFVLPDMFMLPSCIGASPDMLAFMFESCIDGSPDIFAFMFVLPRRGPRRPRRPVRRFAFMLPDMFMLLLSCIIESLLFVVVLLFVFCACAAAHSPPHSKSARTRAKDQSAVVWRMLLVIMLVSSSCVISRAAPERGAQWLVIGESVPVGRMNSTLLENLTGATAAVIAGSSGRRWRQHKVAEVRPVEVGADA